MKRKKERRNKYKTENKWKYNLHGKIEEIQPEKERMNRIWNKKGKKNKRNLKAKRKWKRNKNKSNRKRKRKQNKQNLEEERKKEQTQPARKKERKNTTWNEKERIKNVKERATRN